ncbi:molybdenum ABC transporter ATP-binding protein ModC [Basfia succiniciproducens]|uniref:Molybdate transport system ATP-binding protein n=1 Tax=Basfia succiniciproducens TaxID=653940 RepID=A0A1G5AJB8_9PAST|nr:molybdenum ABC transporter ATP-binding protein ModC [Basfia succiniciproducens]QIM68664.1 molybdenum ABC transporter ATP-binding protein [Basfia succiniciproducens]SCX77945.1 molybdate transport system ATP-binding protein [Basfia succiniciproducens]
MLEINVKKRLGQLVLNARLTIPGQGITGIFGISGSGKSSLINLVSGLIHPDEGNIRLNDRTLIDTANNICLAPNQRNIGYVFQDARLFPHYSVKGNLCYGIKRFNQQEFNRIVRLLGIEHLLARYPLTLSGGEKQRVAIGRALLSNPEMLLMDEPLSALDLPRKRELLAYLEKLSQEINIPILYVTHSLDELFRLADFVVLLDEGKVAAFDSLENLWQSPLFEPWQEQGQKSAVLSLPILSHNFSYKMTALLLGEQQLWVKLLNGDEGKTVRICIRSTDVSIMLTVPEKTSIRNILSGKIITLLPKGNQVDVKIALGKDEIWASVSTWAAEELQLQIGQSVYAQIKAVSVM